MTQTAIQDRPDAAEPQTLNSIVGNEEEGVNRQHEMLSNLLSRLRGAQPEAALKKAPESDGGGPLLDRHRTVLVKSRANGSMLSEICSLVD